ncbi:MAG: hypothetical protein SFV21_14480 [Rhodospirillaceae bacterium]|nr:hypothetical protein [Rhodospirillaceae bacterium]
MRAQSDKQGLAAMDASGMQHFPLTVERQGDGRFKAVLADLPNGPQGWGADRDAAILHLTDQAVPLLNGLKAAGRGLAPSEAGDRPTLALGPMLALTPAPAAPAARPPRPLPNGEPLDTTGMTMNYSWTDGASDPSAARAAGRTG